MFCRGSGVKQFQVFSVSFGIGELILGVVDEASAVREVRMAELLEQHPQLALGTGQTALVAVLDLSELVVAELGVGAEGAGGVGDGVKPAETLHAPVETGNLVEQEVVEDPASSSG